MGISFGLPGDAYFSVMSTGLVMTTHLNYIILEGLALHTSYRLCMYCGNFAVKYRFAFLCSSLYRERPKFSCILRQVLQSSSFSPVDSGTEQ